MDVVASYAGDPSNATKWYANIESVTWLTSPPITVGSRLEFTYTWEQAGTGRTRMTLQNHGEASGFSRVAAPAMAAAIRRANLKDLPISSGRSNAWTRGSSTELMRRNDVDPQQSFWATWFHLFMPQLPVSRLPRLLTQRRRGFVMRDGRQFLPKDVVSLTTHPTLRQSPPSSSAHQQRTRPVEGASVGTFTGRVLWHAQTRVPELNRLGFPILGTL